MTEVWTVEQFKEAMARKKAIEKAADNKYFNKKVVMDGRKFDSEKEGNYYLRLKQARMEGKISHFECQVWFKLIVNDFHVCSYIADFVVYNRNGQKSIIDVKSEYTRKLRVYIIKKKLMYACYGISIQEV